MFGLTPNKYKQKIFQAFWQFGAIFALAVFFGFSINQVQDDPLPLFGNESMKARLSGPSGERIDISLAEAKKLFLQQAAIFIDARPDDDYARGHIKGARSLPSHELDQRLMKVIEDISVDTPIITYCDGEACEMSHDVANVLIDMGFGHVRILANGWTKWKEAELPIEKEDSN